MNDEAKRNPVAEAKPANPTATITESDNDSKQRKSITEAEMKGYGFTIKLPLPRWAVAALAGLLVVGLVALGGYLTYTQVAGRVLVPFPKLNEYQETYKHSLEGSELKEINLYKFADGTKVTVTHFNSDRCIQVVRQTPGSDKAEGIWMFGPGLTPEKQRTQIDGGASNKRGAAAVSPGGLRPLTNGLTLVSNSRASDEPQGTPVNCWDPHPGPWNEQYVPVDQCGVQVWRYFPDGCVHFQWFNRCNGVWDVWPNGAPRVYWQRCVH